MDIFCEPCAAKPGWPFDHAKVIRHACQRCFLLRPCNDYAWKTGRKTIGASLLTKDVAPTNINEAAQTDLPKATPVVQEPIKVVVVEGTREATVAPKPESDADKMLETIYPNRPGIKLERVKKG